MRAVYVGVVSLMCTTSVTAFTLGHGPRSGSCSARASRPAMQFGDMFDDLFGKKEKEEPSEEAQKELEREELKQLNKLASNWEGYQKPEQEGYTFFQSPTPKTGEQSNLPDFFDKSAREDLEIPFQLKLFGGIAGVLMLWLLISLIVT